MKKLKMYGWKACPHCRKTREWLDNNNIPYDYLEIEEQPGDVIREVIDVNGGEDWVVPTLEYDGKWRAGETFDPGKLQSEMKDWGLL